jgi:hypothetical protein
MIAAALVLANVYRAGRTRIDTIPTSTVIPVYTRYRHMCAM